MAEPWGDPSTSPVPCDLDQGHATSSALSLQLMGTALAGQTSPRTSAPSSRACRVCGTGEDYARGRGGGDKWLPRLPELARIPCGFAKQGRPVLSRLGTRPGMEAGGAAGQIFDPGDMRLSCHQELVGLDLLTQVLGFSAT